MYVYFLKRRIDLFEFIFSIAAVFIMYFNLTVLMKKVLFALLLFVAGTAAANNIQVSSFSLTGQNTASDYTMAQFSVSWENSWRDNTNWDAAWIFVKYRVAGGSGGDNAWRHATLSNQSAQHGAPTGSTITPSTDGKGVFLYRNTNGGGNVNYSAVQLRWNYGGDLKSNSSGGVYIGDNDQIEIQVYAIEMVYVPQGSFQVGDGSSSTIVRQFSDAASTAPYMVNSENAITLGGGQPNSLGNRNNNAGVADPTNPDDFSNSSQKLLPAAFPKGYNAYYCMKYETTQKQYVDFLNTLTSSQAAVSVPTHYFNSNGTMQMITGTWPNYYTTAACLPVSYITYFNAMAYLDWSGMRLNTELEYEKSCRGPQTPVADEYAWGTTNLVPALTISASTAEGSCSELTSTQGGNININNGDGAGTGGKNRPYRVGIFATSTSTRESSGASYYGIMDLSGNMAEWTVGVGSANNRSYVGSHGDGLLNSNGNANNADWPGYDGNSVASFATGIRGAAFNYGVDNLGAGYKAYARTSDRYYIMVNNLGNSPGAGFRGVRTAP
ncbi:MAG: SUMF1/EgtB/PvdO family nonheme iron enzyme [Bacteroidota bacterium]